MLGISVEKGRNGGYGKICKVSRKITFKKLGARREFF
jgi:hypothetical protein